MLTLASFSSETAGEGFLHLFKTFSFKQILNPVLISMTSMSSFQKLSCSLSCFSHFFMSVRLGGENRIHSRYFKQWGIYYGELEAHKTMGVGKVQESHFWLLGKQNTHAIFFFFNLRQLLSPLTSELYWAFRIWFLNPHFWEDYSKILAFHSLLNSGRGHKTPGSESKESMLLTEITVARESSFSCSGFLSSNYTEWGTGG